MRTNYFNQFSFYLAWMHAWLTTWYMHLYTQARFEIILCMQGCIQNLGLGEGKLRFLKSWGMGGNAIWNDGGKVTIMLSMSFRELYRKGKSVVL